MKKEPAKLKYKTVALISTKSASPAQFFTSMGYKIIKENTNSLLIKVAKLNQFLLIIKTANISDMETKKILKFADFRLIYEVEDSELFQKLIKMCPTAHILIKNRENSKEVKKTLNLLKIDTKLLFADNFFAFLMNQKSIVRVQRPYFFAEAMHLNDGILTLDCYLNEGLVSKKIVFNNEIFSISEIVTDSPQLPELIFQENENLNFEFQETAFFVKNDEQLIFEEEDEPMPEIELDDEENMVEELNPKDFLNIADLSQPNLEKVQVDEIYKDSILIKNLNSFRGRCLKRTKRYFENQFVTIKINTNLKSLDNLSPLFLNLYNVEGTKTVYTVSFTSSEPIESYKRYFVESDTLNFEMSPLVCKTTTNKICIVKNSLKSGTLTFFGPLLLFSLKFDISNLDVNCSVGVLDCQSRIFVSEKSLEGFFYKIYKRVCVIKGMFGSKKQVNEFKGFRLRTRSGLQGMIKESLGANGVFKAYFFKPILNQEKVYLPLYKQVFLQ